MKNIWFITFIAICVAILLSGYMHWNVKLGNKALVFIKNTSTETLHKRQDMEFSSYILNWPNENQQIFLEKLHAHKPYQISLLISGNMNNEHYSLADHLSEEIQKTFGETVSMNTVVHRTSSSGFIQEDGLAAVLNTNPDMVLIEPFSKMDNEVLPSGQAVDNLDTILNELRAANPDVGLAIIEPVPWPSAINYPREVADIREFAEHEGIPYIAHWDQWPPDDEKALDSLWDGANGRPTELGYEIWSEQVRNYLIGE
ncbi:MAG: SGNH/GDSL hydrolase family protein [Bacillus sp. (in: firmicutes)]